MVFDHGGPEPGVKVCGLSVLKVDPPDLFANLTKDCKPIATKSRKYSPDDLKFIHAEVQVLLDAGVIEKSNSPWRAQVLVAKETNHRKRLVIDYSQTVNRYTQLDAYPLPNLDSVVRQAAQYKVFSSIDLKSAYHQVPLKEEDKPFTAFEADEGLYQFTRLPFGVTNGVGCFQRCVNEFISQNSLKDTFAYLDNVYVCGRDDQEHAENLKKFLAAAKCHNWTFNDSKCEFGIRKLNILGSVVENGEIHPDPDRLKPLINMPVPSDAKELKRVVGLFSYYSKWIPKFSDKIAPLIHVKSFPLGNSAKIAFEELKSVVASAVVQAVDHSLPFELECDASDFALSGVLNQNGRPVAFFSRTLHGPELKWPSVEKEACAIVESVQHWRHYLTGHRFTLRTDQRSVSFMFNQTRKGKVKNDKIYRWRLDLSCYNFDIVYRPGIENVVPDAFSRLFCSRVGSDPLYELHDSLCHPGVTRLTAYIRSKNLPFSVEDVRRTVSTCRICQYCKPRFYRPRNSGIIKATQPMERLNLDFKVPLPSLSKNKYLLVMIDEYSRFPFAVPATDVSTSSTISALTQTF